MSEISPIVELIADNFGAGLAFFAGLVFDRVAIGGGFADAAEGRGDDT